jgi:hypothetical protein
VAGPNPNAEVLPAEIPATTFSFLEQKNLPASPPKHNTSSFPSQPRKEEYPAFGSP